MTSAKKTPGVGPAATALEMVLGEMIALAVRRKRRNALPAHGTHRIAEIGSPLDSRSRAHVHEPKPHPAPVVHRLLSPAECPSPVVLVAFEAVHGHAHLKAQLLVIRDVWTGG